MVIYNKIKRNRIIMETKEFRIQVPEGYEIDVENSTLEYIKFKPVKKNITYEDVCNKLFKNGFYYIGDHGDIRDIAKHSNETYADDTYVDRNNASNIRQLKKLLALNQLLNIARYYNNQHYNSNNWPFCITYHNDNKTYDVRRYDIEGTSLGVVVVFKKEKDAQAVIDNYNFREILDTIYKN